jgi:hypothetical protein
MPFLQAYALNGRSDELTDIFMEIQSDEYITHQACEKLKSLETDVNIQSVISQFCVNSK